MDGSPLDHVMFLNSNCVHPPATRLGLLIELSLMVVNFVINAGWWHVSGDSQKPESDFNPEETYAPTPQIESIRLILAQINTWIGLEFATIGCYRSMSYCHSPGGGANAYAITQRAWTREVVEITLWITTISAPLEPRD